MKLKTILITSVILLLLSTGVAFAITELHLERTNPVNVSPATSNQPLLEMTVTQELPSGTDNVELATVYNNYDETQTVTLDVSNSSEITFTDGTETLTTSVAPNSSATINVDTLGPTKTCAETTNRIAQEYNYQADSSTYTVGQNLEYVDVCQPGNSKPPAGDPSNAEVTMSYDGQIGQGNPRYEFSWSTNLTFDGSAEFYVNGTLVDSGLALNETGYKTREVASGDTVTVAILDSNGNQVDTDTVTVP